jgi:ABC-2 type transport system permease protein
MANVANTPADAAPARRNLPVFLRNPVVLKELRGRMRGPRAFVVLTVYLVLMSGFATLLYYLYSSSLNFEGAAAGGTIGRWLFSSIVAIEMFLVAFIAPTFTAGAISGERERQTYDLLRTTLLPARTLVVGKLISALSYILLLLLAAIPLQSIAFMFGGVTELEIVLSFVVLFVTAIALGAVGIYFSTVIPRTLNASVMTYGVAIFVTLGLPLIILLVASLFGSALSNPNTIGTSTQATLLYLGAALASTNPLTAGLGTEFLLTSNRGAGFFSWNLISMNSTLTIPFVAPWITFTLLYLGISALLVLLAIRRVRRIDP